MKSKLQVTEKDKNLRLDILITIKIAMSRSRVSKLISEGFITVNSSLKKPSYHVKFNDVIEIEIPEEKKVDIAPQDIPIDIIYEDSHIIVINKQRNFVVHPSAGHEDGTLVNALLFHCKDLKGVRGEFRPGIVHRIDKDTTGLLVVAKNDEAMDSLSEQIASHSSIRKYKALVEGIVKEDGIIDEPIGRCHNNRKKQAVVANGRFAQTYYKVEQIYKNNALLDVTLKTGRTHQIRVHFAHVSHPVVGDALYGYKKQRFNLQGQLLHAYSLEFKHPKTNKMVKFNAPLPDDFLKVINVLEKQAGIIANSSTVS